MATRYCETCGQPVLRTDAACWHCGAKLAPVPAPDAAQHDAAGQTAAAAARPAREPYALVYAGLAAAVAVALLLITTSLGRRPLLLQGVTGGAGDWVALSGPGGHYRANIPAHWSWQQAQDGAARTALAERAAADPVLDGALMPLAGFISDIELLLLAEDGGAFFLLGRSPNLAGLELGALESALRAEVFSSSTITRIESLTTDAGQVGLALDVEQAQPAQWCRQLVLPGEAWGYLAAACTAAPDSTANELLQTLLLALQIRD